MRMLAALLGHGRDDRLWTIDLCTIALTKTDPTELATEKKKKKEPTLGVLPNHLHLFQKRLIPSLSAIMNPLRSTAASVSRLLVRPSFVPGTLGRSSTASNSTRFPSAPSPSRLPHSLVALRAFHSSTRERLFSKLLLLVLRSFVDCFLFLKSSVAWWKRSTKAW